jgi:hypothetical protein
MVVGAPEEGTRRSGRAMGSKCMLRWGWVYRRLSGNSISGCGGPHRLQPVGSRAAQWHAPAIGSPRRRAWPGRVLAHARVVLGLVQNLSQPRVPPADIAEQLG